MDRLSLMYRVTKYYDQVMFDKYINLESMSVFNPEFIREAVAVVTLFSPIF